MPDQDDDEEEEGEEEESTLSYSSSWNKSNYSAVKVSKNNGMNVLIKPKERLGQSMQAKTITNKNSLMEIGSYANTDTSFASTTAPADTDNPVNVNLNPSDIDITTNFSFTSKALGHEDFPPLPKVIDHMSEDRTK